ncbi:MAG TPA: GNAT family N-acetyltransferase [Streptosporangiaceae bacterium]|nr:GNAT family N-acetyltransferase [Streptosporangiaceae bacterium]
MTSPITDTDIAALDLAAARTWRGTEEEPLGGWLLRAAEGFTGRANSVLTAGDPGLPLPEATARVRRWYTDRGLTPMASISYPAGRPDRNPVDRFLAGQGWPLRDEAEVIVMTRAAAGLAAIPVAPIPVAPIPAALPVRFDDQPSDDWLALYHFRGQPDLPPVARAIMTSAPWQAFASARDGDRTVAIGRVAGAGEWAGLTAIEVDPDYRRRGLAVAVTVGLIDLAARHGAGRVYLQVEDGNEAALALYRRLGFTVHHGYHYRVAPAGS